MYNETAGYHQYNLHLPIFVKEASRGWKRFFSQKYTFFIHFSNFDNFPIFLSKNPINRTEKTFLWNTIILYAFYSKFVTFNDTEETIMLFLQKKHLFFQWNHQSLNVLRNTLIQTKFTAVLLQFGQKKVTFGSVNKVSIVAWTQLENIG